MGRLTDKALVSERFRRSLASYGREAVVQRSMASGLVAMLARHSTAICFERVLEVGAGSGMLTELMLDAFSIRSYTANDLVAESRECLEEIFRRHCGVAFDFRGGDAESLAGLPDRLDLVVSSATLQWFDDLGLFFSKMDSLLEPGSLFAFTTFGNGTMQEIAALTGAGLSYLEPEALADLAERHFEVLELSGEEISLSFSSPEAVLRHIGRTGVNGLSRAPWTKGRHREFSERYGRLYSCEGGVRLTYRPLYCCLRKKTGGAP
ncbi:malonyl-ACP O-methyltransferase BioC [Chlorobium sp. N1]|uniref:malonyl-ACP O-methyltransferase BioC n=1 Tax=Chlorobium sp. N1 TaxID=2491138 RepID=UPI00103D81A2|nr:malonyl-ACP O-methyltransferase BioC [Chlorobium sp. N1]TCD48138.1 malonyl-[acyl-carrier protein] O-methyltransferase BioC [Chlorobium sp. N1]